MKTYLYGKETVKVIKNLNVKTDKPGVVKELKDKAGTWVQIEFLTGERKGYRVPAPKEELK